MNKVIIEWLLKHPDTEIRLFNQDALVFTVAVRSKSSWYQYAISRHELYITPDPQALVNYCIIKVILRLDPSWEPGRDQRERYELSSLGGPDGG